MSYYRPMPSANLAHCQTSFLWGAPSTIHGEKLANMAQIYINNYIINIAKYSGWEIKKKAFHCVSKKAKTSGEIKLEIITSIKRRRGEWSPAFRSTYYAAVKNIEWKAISFIQIKVVFLFLLFLFFFFLVLVLRRWILLHRLHETFDIALENEMKRYLMKSKLKL